MLPRKRDSVVEDHILQPVPSTGLKLAVPQQDISRSASPVLGPMSARISDTEAAPQQSMDSLSDPQLSPMSARVAN